MGLDNRYGEKFNILYSKDKGSVDRGKNRDYGNCMGNTIDLGAGTDELISRERASLDQGRLTARLKD